jgi:hypothetical protein
MNDETNDALDNFCSGSSGAIRFSDAVADKSDRHVRKHGADTRSSEKETFLEVGRSSYFIETGKFGRPDAHLYMKSAINLIEPMSRGLSPNDNKVSDRPRERALP